MEIDRIDAGILTALQKDNKLTSDQLSFMVNLSATAVQRRLKRLRANGVIEADVSIISPKAVGRPISMLVFVTLERERASIIDRFKQRQGAFFIPPPNRFSGLPPPQKRGKTRNFSPAASSTTIPTSRASKPMW